MLPFQIEDASQKLENQALEYEAHHEEEKKGENKEEEEKHLSVVK